MSTIEDVHNSEPIFFPGDQCVLLYMNDVTESSLVIEYEKFINMISDSTMQLIFKK